MIQKRVQNVEFPRSCPVVCKTGGRSYVTCNREIMYDGSKVVMRGGKPYLLSDIERIASRFTEMEWRIYIEQDGFDRIYQRDNGRWFAIN